LFGPHARTILVVVHPARTETLPQSKRNGLEGPDPITALRLRGVDIEHVMLAGQPRFALGSAASCDIVVDRGYVSSLHAMLERRENRIRVIDVSKNGIVFHGRYEKQFDIGPGDSFSIGDTTCYVLNDEMRLARPVLAEVLGAARFEVIDDLTMTAVHGDHVLVLTEPGNDQERLARAIHSSSLRRRHHFVKAIPNTDGRLDRQLITYAERGTLWLDLEPVRVTVDPTFIEQLLLPDSNVRVVISARTLEIARKSLGIELAATARRAELLLPVVRHLVDERRDHRALVARLEVGRVKADLVRDLLALLPALGSKETVGVRLAAEVQDHGRQSAAEQNPIEIVEHLLEGGELRGGRGGYGALLHAPVIFLVMRRCNTLIR
jgi:hypothetical protein